MDLGGGLAAAVGAIAFFGSIVAGQWISHRSEAQKRQLEHEARMKALELGKSLPDVPDLDAEKKIQEDARSRADISRARAAGTIGTLVPLATIGGAVGVSAMIFNSFTGDHVAFLAIVWGVAGVVCVVTICLSIGLLWQRGSSGLPSGVPSNPRSRFPDGSSTAFTDRPSNL